MYRFLLRLAAIGILIVSCNDNITGPTEYCAQPDTDVALNPDSLHLVVGSADRVWVQWGCFVTPPTAEIDWIIRDPTVASDGGDTSSLFSPNDPARIIQPQAPGRTFLVVVAGELVDSLVVSVPDTVAMGTVTFIAAGGQTSCAVSDGDIALCWGNGSGSVLGLPSVDPAIGTCWGTPCSPMPVPRKTDARSVQVSSTHACSLDTFGSAWCWGDNSALQLGVSQNTPAFEPVAVSGGLTFTTLTLGLLHTCGLTPVGTAYCWGDNSRGELGGNQRSGSISTPELVAGDLQWVSLDARDETTCGVTDAGHFYCWGILNSFAPTLAGTKTCEVSGEKGSVFQKPCSYVPLRMPLDAGLTADSLFVQVSGPCPLTSLGSVFCYDFASSAYTPMVGFGPFAAISGGNLHRCGLTTGGAAWCWGSNQAGRLGDGTTEGRDEPVAVTGGHTFTQLALGRSHTCGLTANGEVWCWGANDLGQAGTSIMSQPWAPVKVHGQG